MSLTILGIDIAKQKFDVALLTDGKIKHKTCKNSTEGFEYLILAGETGHSKGSCLSGSNWQLWRRFSDLSS